MSFGNIFRRRQHWLLDEQDSLQVLRNDTSFCTTIPNIRNENGEENNSIGIYAECYSEYQNDPSNGQQITIAMIVITI
jgi:hypothetical protein